MIGLTRRAATAALSQWDADGSGGILSDRIVRWDTFCTWTQLTEFKSMFLKSACELLPKTHCCKLSVMVPHGLYLYTSLNFHSKTDDDDKEEEKHMNTQHRHEHQDPGFLMRTSYCSHDQRHSPHLSVAVMFRPISTSCPISRQLVHPFLHTYGFSCSLRLCFVGIVSL